MNQSSLSISDVGKSSTLLNTGSVDAATSSESDESGSFFSTLSALFQSDTESVESTDDSKIKTSESDLKAQSTDKLIDIDLEAAEEGEESDSILKVGSESAGDSDVKHRESAANSKSEQVAAVKTMSEGNELLDRLDESNQALNNKSGNALPPEEELTSLSKDKSQSDESPNKSVLTAEGKETADYEQVVDKSKSAGNSQIVAKSQATDNNQVVAKSQATDNNQVVAKSQVTDNTQVVVKGQTSDNSQVVAKGQTMDNSQLLDKSQNPDDNQPLDSRQSIGNNQLVDKSQTTDNSQNANSDLAATKNQHVENSEFIENKQHTGTDLQVEQSADLEEGNLKTAASVGSLSALSSTNDVEQLKSVNDAEFTNVSDPNKIVHDELVWGNTSTPRVSSEPDTALGKAVGVSVPAAYSTIDKAKLESTMAELNLTDVPLEELSAEEIEYLVQVNNVTASPAPESIKIAADHVKPAVISMGVAQQLHQQQQHAAQLNNAALQSSAETNTAQLNQAQNTNSAPMTTTAPNMLTTSMATPNMVNANNINSQQQMMGAALAAAGAGSLAKAGDKGDAKDSALSQQLSGLAAQQGIQQAQTRADVQQAVQQSPLHLSREVAGEKVAEQIQMMLSKNLKNIDIRLDPPELGRMQIRMTMNGDAAAVQFTVANPQAKELVEHAMPRLREMLAQQGLQLSDSSVHQQKSGQQSGQYASSGGNNGSGRAGLSADGEPNVDESINLGVNIQSKDDGISFYA